MKYVIAAILGVTILAGGIYGLTTLVDDTPAANKDESLVSLTVNGKMGVKISDMLCTTSTGVEVCLN